MRSLQFIALRLAALSGADRRWLLRQLTKAERNHLKPKLEEALQLSSADLLAAMEAPALDLEKAPSQMPDQVGLHGLEQAGGRHLIALLDSLPVSCTALLLDQKRWTWSEEVESFLSTDERQGLPKMLLELRGRVSIRFERLMVDQIAMAVRNDTLGSRTAARASKFDTLLGS